MSVRFTWPVKRAAIGPIFTEAVAFIVGVGQSFPGSRSPGCEAFSTSGSFSASHTLLARRRDAPLAGHVHGVSRSPLRALGGYL